MIKVGNLPTLIFSSLPYWKVKIFVTFQAVLTAASVG